MLGDPLNPEAIEVLGQCSLPALEPLALRLCSEATAWPLPVKEVRRGAVLDQVHEREVPEIKGQLHGRETTPSRNSAIKTSEQFDDRQRSRAP